MLCNIAPLHTHKNNSSDPTLVCLFCFGEFHAPSSVFSIAEKKSPWATVFFYARMLHIMRTKKNCSGPLVLIVIMLLMSH